MAYTIDVISALGDLQTGINDTAVSAVLTAGQGAEFPAGGASYTAYIQSGGTLETVTVTNRVSDTLTITRGSPAYWFPAGAFVFRRVTYTFPINGGNLGLSDIFTATTSGDVPASGGGTVNFLRADGTWAAPGGGSGAAIRSAVVSVPTALMETTVSVTDALISSGMLIIPSWGAVLETDENSPGMDNVSMSAVAGTGNFTLRLASSRPIRGAFRINYAVL